MTTAKFYIGKIQEEFDYRTETYFDQRLTIVSPKGVRIAERLILQEIPQNLTGKVLVINSREGIIPAALTLLNSSEENKLEIFAFYSELVDYQKTQMNFKQNNISSVNLIIDSAPFFDEKDLFDVILLPMQHTIELDLAREWIVRASQLLKTKGKLWVSVDTRKKNQFATILGKCFKTIESPTTTRSGKVWIAEKNKKDKPPKLAGFANYTAKDGDTIAAFKSQPGVFAHGRIDEGARALLKVLEMGEEGETILDLGCGSGELGIMAALRDPKAKVLLTDANTRAVQMAKINAKELIPDRFEVILSSNIGEELSERKFSLILTNPPYFSHYRISQLFLTSIKKLLDPVVGRFYLVTKQANWHREAIAEEFQLEDEFSVLGYSVFLARCQ